MVNQTSSASRLRAKRDQRGCSGPVSSGGVGWGAEVGRCRGTQDPGTHSKSAIPPLLHSDSPVSKSAGQESSKYWIRMVHWDTRLLPAPVVKDLSEQECRSVYSLEMMTPTPWISGFCPVSREVTNGNTLWSLFQTLTEKRTAMLPPSPEIQP